MLTCLKPHEYLKPKMEITSTKLKHCNKILTLSCLAFAFASLFLRFFNAAFDRFSTRKEIM